MTYYFAIISYENLYPTISGPYSSWEKAMAFVSKLQELQNESSVKFTYHLIENKFDNAVDFG